MNVLTVVFGGVDHKLLAQWDCPHLQQAEWGPVTVDQLHDQRDVASQITAQLITGQTWRENGVLDRKKQTLVYRKPLVERLETSLLRDVAKGRARRRRLFEAMGWLDIVSREYVHSDLQCPSLFDLIENSRAVYVPAYNPEPSWALGRNILDPRRYPDLGVAAAEDLREKNFQWRRTALLDALSDGPYRLLMGQFQYIDSSQHLYLTYHRPQRHDLVEAAYKRMDDFAAEILDRAHAKYDRVLFVSDNGAARDRGTRPTHHNRPFYSVNAPLELGRPNLRDFFDMIVRWSREPAHV